MCSSDLDQYAACIVIKLTQGAIRQSSKADSRDTCTFAATTALLYIVEQRGALSASKRDVARYFLRLIPEGRLYAFKRKEAFAHQFFYVFVCKNIPNVPSFVFKIILNLNF